jgi:hypothetical protein
VNTLKRYGIEWTGPKTPIAVSMKDGHWTPWHLAQERIVELEGIPTHVFTRRPFRPRIDTPEKQAIYTKGFEDALKEVQFNIDKAKGGAG